MKIETNEFALEEVFKFENILSKKHPKNNTIKASIRRNLQELRDLGLIIFLNKGHYKKSKVINLNKKDKFF